MSNLRKILLLIFITSLIGGCSVDFYRPNGSAAQCYYRNPAKNITNIGRVAIIELQNYSSYPQISADVTEALFQQLQKKQVFGLLSVRSSDPDWKNLQIPPDGPQNLQQLASIRKTLNCNAIIFGSVTEYQPHPHLSIGLRLKMVDLTDGQLVWGFEQLWDSADKNIQDRAKKYFKSQKKADLSQFSPQLVSTSSIEFLKFVTYEVTQCF